MTAPHNSGGASHQTVSATAPRLSVGLIALIYLSYISLGLPDAVFSVGWPAMRVQWGQSVAAVGLITIVGTISAIASAYLSPYWVKRWGIGRVVALSATGMMGALLGLVWAPSFAWAVLMSVPSGFCGGAVDVALNRMVAERLSAKHMNWLHGCWGIGASTGPLLMAIALRGSEGWQSGVIIIAACLGGMALLLWCTTHWWSDVSSPVGNASATHIPQALHQATHQQRMQRAMWISPVLFFLYVSAELGTGLWAASILSEQRGLPLSQAGLWVSFYFGALTIGRFAVGLIARRVGNRLLVRLGGLLALSGATLFAMPQLPPWMWLAGLMLMGAGCAPIFPSMMHETARRFSPENMGKVMARQTSLSYIGASCTPAAFGLLASAVSLNAIMPVVMALLVLLVIGSVALDQLTPKSSADFTQPR
jgi:MFS family permease